MKRLLSTALFLAMLLTMATPALAVSATPVPPDWVDGDQYLIFADETYDQETWDVVAKLRADAAGGNREPRQGDDLYAAWQSGNTAGYKGPVWLRFELGLIGMKYAENAENHRQAGMARRYFSLAQSGYVDTGGSREDPEYYLMGLWYYRARLLECHSLTNQVFSGTALENFLKESGYTMEQFRSYAGLSVIPEAEWAEIDQRTAREKAQKAAAEAAAKTRVSVTLDGKPVDTEGLAVVKNGRTMIPIRGLAELLGAEVSYDSTLKAARIVRAGVEILMPIGKTTATVDGKPVEMDVAPYIENGRTMIPARYVSEFFGQTIQWVAESRTAAVTENKSLAGDANLEAWALAMGSYLNHVRTARADVFGGRSRATVLSLDLVDGHQVHDGSLYVFPCDEARYILSDSWDIHNRDDLIATVFSMTHYGHNETFLHTAVLIESLSSAAYQDLLKDADTVERYMFPYTKQLYDKWGDRGILCWDLFRMSNLVQWGYTAGYLTYPEALALLEPAATLLRNNFKDWDEAYENYLDGYNWWAQENVLGKDPWTVTRGPTVKRMLQQYGDAVFSDDLFRRPISGVPGLTMEDLLRQTEG